MTRHDDDFPLIEETDDPSELPTVEEWLAAGAPLREIASSADNPDDAEVDRGNADV